MTKSESCSIWCKKAHITDELLTNTKIWVSREWNNAFKHSYIYFLLVLRCVS